jgi:hypothetical protein
MSDRRNAFFANARRRRELGMRLVRRSDMRVGSVRPLTLIDRH